MKTKFYLLIVLLFCLCNLGYSQTGIGVYSVHDGGFENHTVGNIAGGSTTNLALSTTAWTASTTSGTAITRAILSTGGRSGSQCASFGSLSTTTKSFYTPQISGAFAANTKYQIQFWYKPTTTTATLASSSVDLYVDNASATAAPASIGTKQTVAAGLDKTKTDWTKVAVEITTNATAAGSFGLAAISFTTAAASTNFTASFDDFVIYQAAAADTSAPNSPGTVTATGASSSTATVSWGAASGGVDGGGYVVVRYATTAPSASDDPLQNGIYKFASTIGAGVVRYIGSSTSFTDTSLSAGVDYYYKVYTVDKAFNYSNESTTSASVQALATTYYYKGTGLLTDVANWGTNTNGSGTAPSNFTDVAQVFEIRNTTAVTLDGAWTVGTDPANGTKVRLGNTDQGAITLTLNAGASILPAGTGNLDVMTPISGKQTVIYKGTTAISFGNIFDSNLEVIYDGVTISSTTTKSFGTVTIKNGANVTFTATPIIKNISVDATSTLVTPTNASSYITIPSGGVVTIYGTVKVLKLTGFVSSNVGTAGSAGGDLQFIGAENLTLGANSIVEYARDAAGAQTVTARTDYKNLTVSGTSPKSIAGATTISGTFTINQGGTLVTLSSDTTVNGTLVFTSGKIDTGTNTLILGSSASISGAGTSSGWVIGNLRKTTSSGASPSFTYTIGDANYYTPLALTFANNTSATGTLTAKTASGDHAQIATSGITASNSINRTWTLTNSNLAGLSTYNASFTYATQDNDSNSSPQFFASRLYNGSSWTNLTTSGTPTSTSFSASSISGFGDFAIGQVCINPTLGGTVTGTQSICENGNPSNFLSTVAASGNVGNLEYKWQSSTNNVSFSDIVGATSSTYDAPAGLTTTTYYKRIARVDCKSDWTGAAESNVLTVTVNPILTPTFTQVNSICFGNTLSDLPTTSLNNIFGSWSPTINSDATTVYTFTPSDQCSLSTTMTVVVNRSLAGTISSNQTITSGALPADISLSNSSGAVQWQSSSNGVSFSNINGATGTTLLGSTIGALTNNTYFRAIVNDGGCGNVTSGTVSVTIITTTNVRPSQCGSTLSALDTQILATIYPSAQMYRFEVSNGATLNTYDTANYNFDLTKVPGTAYATTYGIRVAVKVSGVWGNYGSSCNVSTPTLSSNTVLTTTVHSNFCGATLSSLDTRIAAAPVQSATGYRFEIIAAGVTTVYNSASYNFRLTEAGLVAAYGTTYAIRVAALVNGVYGNYGASCNVTTPTLSTTNIPTTSVIPSYCGTTLATLDTKIGAIPVPAASGYRFEITTAGVTTVYDSTVYNFRLADAGVAAYGTTYSIRVAALVSGTYGNYGSSCSVATPALNTNTVPTTTINPIFCGTTLAALDTKIGAVIVSGATKGRFEITIAGGSPVVYEVAAYNFKLSQTGVAVLYNTNYAIRVAAYVNGVWGNYGASCTVTTPAAPAPARLKAKSFEVSAYPNPFHTAFNLNLETPSKEEVTIAVYDMMGRQVENQVVNAKEIENISLGQNYSNGIYNVIVKQGKDVKTLRLIKR